MKVEYDGHTVALLTLERWAVKNPPLNLRLPGPLKRV
jgi:hypothetical protein